MIKAPLMLENVFAKQATCQVGEILIIIQEESWKIFLVIVTEE